MCSSDAATLKTSALPSLQCISAQYAALRLLITHWMGILFMLARLKRYLRQRSCSHEFSSSGGDIILTGIALPPRPDVKTDFKGHMDWLYCGVKKSEGYKKRIYCECQKCHKGFYAHCGLDLIKYGELV